MTEKHTVNKPKKEYEVKSYQRSFFSIQIQKITRQPIKFTTTKIQKITRQPIKFTTTICARISRYFVRVVFLDKEKENI